MMDVTKLTEQLLSDNVWALKVLAYIKMHSPPCMHMEGNVYTYIYNLYMHVDMGIYLQTNCQHIGPGSKAEHRDIKQFTQSHTVCR